MRSGAVTVPVFADVLKQWHASPFEVGIDGRAFLIKIGANEIALPCEHADARLDGDPNGPLFLEWLRMTFERELPHDSTGGFIAF